MDSYFSRKACLTLQSPGVRWARDHDDSNRSGRWWCVSHICSMCVPCAALTHTLWVHECWSVTWTLHVNSGLTSPPTHLICASLITALVWEQLSDTTWSSAGETQIVRRPEWSSGLFITALKSLLSSSSSLVFIRLNMEALVGFLPASAFTVADFLFDQTCL